MELIVTLVPTIPPKLSLVSSTKVVLELSVDMGCFLSKKT